MRDLTREELAKHDCWAWKLSDGQLHYWAANWDGAHANDEWDYVTPEEMICIIEDYRERVLEKKLVAKAAGCLDVAIEYGQELEVI